MRFTLFKNAVEINKHLVKKMVKEGDITVDATVGNGNDTILLAELVGDTGKVYGFDIQCEAITNTENILKKRKLDMRVKLINDGHEHMDKYIESNVDFVVFNLGYLPGSDHKIITKPDTTIKALNLSLSLLKKGGKINITSYYGHPGGLEEKTAIEKFLLSLDQKMYNVIKFSFVNQVNNPPILYCIEKLTS